MLMLLCVHVTRLLFLVLAGNFALTMELHTLTLVACSYVLLHAVVSPQYMQEAWHMKDCIKPRVGGEMY